MSLTYRPSFNKSNCLQKSMGLEATHNSVDESLQFWLDQTEANQSYKVAHQPKHQRLITQVHETTHSSLQQFNLKNSMLTQASQDYFQAIQCSLLLLNQNLKNHNRYLLDQVNRLFMKEKAIKKMLVEHQNTIKTLQSIIQESRINLRRFFEDMVVLIEELQVVNSTRKEGMLRDERKGRQKASSLYLKEESETSSQTIFHSLENIKNIFSQSQIMDEKRLNLHDYAFQQQENPENYEQACAQMAEDCIYKENEQSVDVNEQTDWQAHNNASNLPILCSFKSKILNLCMKISSQTRTTSKGACFKKQSSMSRY